ncbi:LysR family substrate-binding domain-containing protein, partial [Nocardioides sp. NPDC000441]
PVVALADLRTEPFVAYSARDSAVNEAVLRSCREAGFVPRREHEAPSTAVLLALVAAGLGVAVLPASVRALPLEGVVFRDLLDAGSVELSLAYRTDDDNPVVDAVIEILEAADLFTAPRLEAPRS